MSTPLLCDTCEDHFIKNYDNTKCGTIVNCDIMSNEATCRTCLTGYTLISNTCV